MEETKKITSANEYKEQLCKTKIAELPSGAVFEIKELTQRDYLIEGGSIISDLTGAILSGEKKEILEEKLKKKIASMTFEQRKDYEKNQKAFFDSIIIKCVINPKISATVQPDLLFIEDIKDLDYFKLIEEISNLSSMGGDVTLNSFRKEPDADNSG